MLLIAPPPLAAMPTPWFSELFKGGREKTIELAKQYRNLARFLQIAFLDAGEIMSTDGVDGIHFSEGNNLALGQAVARLVGSEILPE